jgi:protein kinase-like protein
MTDETQARLAVEGMNPSGACSTEVTRVGSRLPRNPSSMPVVPGYDLLRVLGRGGMGIVWEAIEHRLERHVALKVHCDDLSPERVAQMWSEARLAAKVADPGVVAVHDLGTTLDGSPYYTMDLVVGTDLRALLREGPLPQARALSLALQIARAVAAAHDRGIIHRDLKPSNILIDDQGRPRILDFGLALNSGVGKDMFEHLVFGTPAYMSPEQVSAEPVGAAADIHAIGIVLYEMLTGLRPFAGDDRHAIMQAVLARQPDPPSAKNRAIHLDVERVVLRCLQKKPEDRFPSTRALVAALEAAEFRDLFSDEMLAEGEHMTVSHMAFLFVDYVELAELPKTRGDAETRGDRRRVKALVDEQLRAHRGALVPASLDKSIAAFHTSAAAVRAAMAIVRAVGDRESFRMAVHEGRCIALTRAGRTEHFGRTLQRGIELLAESPAGGVLLSEVSAGERAVAEALQEAGALPEVVATGTRVMRLATGRDSRA